MPRSNNEMELKELLPPTARPDYFLKGVTLVTSKHLQRSGSGRRRRRQVSPHDRGLDNVHEYLPPLEGISNRQLHKAEAAAKAVGGIGVVAFSPDGRKVATEVMEKKIVLLDVRTGERLSVLEASNATVQGVATASEVPEEQRIQDIEEVDLMRRHLMTARSRADEAEKELRRLRIQTRELRETNDANVARVATLEGEAEQLRAQVEEAEVQKVAALEKALQVQQASRESERREKAGALRLQSLEEKVAKLELEHAAEVRQLRHEVELAKLRTDVDATRADVKRLEAQQEGKWGAGTALTNMTRMFGSAISPTGTGGATGAVSPLAAAATNLRSVTLKTLRGFTTSPSSTGNNKRESVSEEGPEDLEETHLPLAITGTTPRSNEGPLARMGRTVQQSVRANNILSSAAQDCRQS